MLFMASDGSDCFEEGNLHGFDLDQKGKKTDDVRECQKLCQKTPGCEYWTYAKKERSLCYTKTRIDNWNSTYSRGEDQNPTGKISGPKWCCFTREEGLARGYPTGGRSTTVTSYMECQQMCQKNDKCKYFSFNGRSMKCYLKTDIPDTTANTVAMWGPEVCPIGNW